jgi:hypothetical protein
MGSVARFLESEHELRLPGAWYLSSLPKRGIQVRATYRTPRPVPPPLASVRPIATGIPAILTRIENWVIQHSGEPGWNVRPRLTLPRRASSATLIMRPFSRQVTAWEHPSAIKLAPDRPVNNLPGATFQILPEFPSLDLKPERVVEPEYAFPMPDLSSSTQGASNWIRHSELALPLDRSSRIHGMQPVRGHVHPSLQPSDTETRASESRLPVMAVRAKPHAAGRLPASLNPGPTHPRSGVSPSLIAPKLQGCNSNSSSLLEASPNPRLFRPAQKFSNAAIPKAETDAALQGPRMWFAVRVPLPHLLETPTPVDMSKRLHYVHAARHRLSSTAIPAEVVLYPPGLRAGQVRILQAVPDPLSDSAVFQMYARRLTASSLPELSELRLSKAFAIRGTLDPVDRHTEIREPFSPQPFSMGPAVLWSTTRNEAGLRETGAATREIHPVPDSPDFSPFQRHPHAEPGWVFQLADSIGAGFAISVARTCEPETGQVAIPDLSYCPWKKIVDRTSGSAGVPEPVRPAPALASFRRIANPESMQSSFATDLRDRIFNPILPASPRTRLRPPGVEATGFRLRESRGFASLDFRWQRERKVRDRGASWKAPAGICSLPTCEIPQWPGPVFSDGWPDAPWGDGQARLN